VQSAVFLDRDNTLIVGDDDIGDPDEVRLMDGVAEGILALRHAGFAIVVVTNQGGVARGKYTEDDVDAVNQRIAMLVDEAAGESHLIDRFYYCPYHPEAVIEEYRRDHPWRKPHPGMLLQAARDLHLDLSQSWLIGDQRRDIEAGRAAGCRTVLISSNSDEPHEETDATAHARSFSEAAACIMESPAAQEARSGMHEAVRSQTGSSSEPIGRQTARPTGNRAAPTTGPAHTPEEHFPIAPAGETRRMRRAVQELTEELRSDRLHRTEFTALRLLAGVVQLLVLLCVLQGLLEVRNTDVFLKWMSGGILLQLSVITLLVVDMRR